MERGEEMRFSIRDVLWFMVVVGPAVLWQMEVRHKNPTDLRSENIRLQQELALAQANAKGATALIQKLQSQIDGQGQR